MSETDESALTLGERSLVPSVGTTTHPMTVYDALEELVILQFGTQAEKDDQRNRFGLSDAEFWSQIEFDSRSFRGVGEGNVARACWQRIDDMIIRGPLPGNGTDRTAQRNGLILAANAIYPLAFPDSPPFADGAAPDTERSGTTTSSPPAGDK